jgi:hypothetical protein
MQTDFYLNKVDNHAWIMEYPQVMRSFYFSGIFSICKTEQLKLFLKPTVKPNNDGNKNLLHQSGVSGLQTNE